MKVLIGEKWKDGFLDETLTDHTVRIRVKEWYNLQAITDIYIMPKKKWRIIYNYLREVGILNVIRKVKSRLAEIGRNDKFISVGSGYIIESRSENFQTGQFVIFIASCQPRCMEQVVLFDKLVNADEPLWRVDKGQLGKGYIRYGNFSQLIPMPKEFYSLIGWTEFSGKVLPQNLPEIINKSIKQILVWSDVQSCEKLPAVLKQKIHEINRLKQNSVEEQKNKLTGVIFGYGQYAKTCILPNIKKHIHITCIHEIDPTQVGNDKKHHCFDTSSVFRPEEHYDICFLAGYHHTHAPLAVAAIENDISVVVEKPLVTTWADLSSLLDVISKKNALFYSGFQKRYAVFNKYIYQDLAVELGSPISYSCIVFEIPLGDLHWYKWPNSKSRILSNGCHWIDHFLFLNNYCKVYRQSIYAAKNGEINVVIELTNGALFTMLLTEVGSSRIGLQEYMELRANDATVKITNSSVYIAESSRKILRKFEVNKLSSYHRMYKLIAENFSKVKQGDSFESIKLSSTVILSLEDELQDSIATN